MADLSREDYARELVADVLATAEVESATTPLVFTRRVLDDLEQAGVAENTFTAHYYRHGVEVHGYGSNETLQTLDLFVTHFRQHPLEQRMSRTEAEALFKRLSNFLRRCRDGLRQDIEESSDLHDMCEAVEKALPDTPRIRLFLLTNSVSGLSSLPATDFDGIPVTREIWDLGRLHRMATSGTLSEPIVVDFETPLPCLVTPDTREDYTVLLAIMPGPTLATLYAGYGTRLLELNVRSFLQTKGAVNRGIRETLLNDPGRFLAYNNGITATASQVEFVQLADRGRAIKRIHDLQIVNGGQTTASLHYAQSRDKADLSNVSVQMKLTVVPAERLQDIVPDISRYSNTQNKVTLVDFSSNHPYHVKVEKITRSLWAPAPDGSGQETRWFYERARGQYTDALARERTRARQDAFRKIHPLRQKFTKADAAKFDHSWNQLPHFVSRGAEKNFREFMIRLTESEPVVDVSYCQRLIAQAILFKATEKIVSEHNFGGYRANIVTYTIARLSESTGRRIDLDRIWREQRLTPALTSAIHYLCVPVQAVITRPLRGTHVGEWTKRPECWDTVVQIPWTVPPSLQAELTDHRPAHSAEAVDGQTAPAGSGRMTTVMASRSEDWFALAKWAKETQNLQPWQRQLAFSIGRYLSNGWTVSERQAHQALVSLEEARRLGFQQLT
ncbi:MAG TPA: AIPR family protein [Kribbellaceae bacterium]|nr:AIPR family protein [Kribbellaceae bacterium]